MKNLIFIGPPGSGKGTQADILSRTEYKFIKISAGDLLREEVSRNTELGEKIHSYIKEGNLVPDELVCNAMSVAIRSNIDRNLIFDGFPRRVSQAEKLSIELDRLKLDLDGVINFDLSAEILYERIRNRRVCRKCKSSFNIQNQDSQVLDKCIYCQSEDFFIREDDKKETFERRMQIYEKENKEIIEYYRNITKIFTVKADNLINNIAKDIEIFLMSI